MENDRTTLSRFLAGNANFHGDARGELSALILDIATACRQIGEKVREGSLGSATANATTKNLHGETQHALDLVANEYFLRANESGGRVAAMVSEEMDEPFIIGSDQERGNYLLAFDPLDGSSNINVNVTVGSIFSLLQARKSDADGLVTDFMQPGYRQICAGYAIYGPSTMLVLTLGRGVHGFTLDPKLGIFFLTHSSMKIPAATSEFAINASNNRFWEPAVARYIDECLAGAAGPRGKDFNMRWVASLVAEVHRILIRGGVFLYPRDRKDPTTAGRLRLLYEANPISFIVEQAGGRSISGRERILDVKPSGLHQRTGLIFGAQEEVDRIEAYHRDRRIHREEAPLFGNRGLFRTPA
jgi:fructose-1,6-bisphosphatase I / sedoheptulose-1,7-bisphosphatase